MSFLKSGSGSRVLRVVRLRICQICRRFVEKYNKVKVFRLIIQTRNDGFFPLFIFEEISKTSCGNDRNDKPAGVDYYAWFTDLYPAW